MYFPGPLYSYHQRFQQEFDLEAYLTYEQEKLAKQHDLNHEQQEALYTRLEAYDYENDADYTKGLPGIIHQWLDQQSKGLWDKEKLDFEFQKAKAYYYVA